MSSVKRSNGNLNDSEGDIGRKEGIDTRQLLKKWYNSDDSWRMIIETMTIQWPEENDIRVVTVQWEAWKYNEIQRETMCGQ